MISDFIEQKLGSAKYKILSDGTYFGAIPGVAGVWANAKKLEDCRNELQEVLEDWLAVSLYRQRKVPGIKLNLRAYA